MGLVFISIQPICFFLVGAFNLLTFKVIVEKIIIIDIYVPIAIFLIVLGWLCTLMAESEEELKNLLMKVKEESEKLA